MLQFSFGWFFILPYWGLKYSLRCLFASLYITQIKFTSTSYVFFFHSDDSGDDVVMAQHLETR